MTRPHPMVLASIASLAILGACQPGELPGSEYMPDMARGPTYKAFAPNQAMHNGITLQRPVAGTIARGHKPFHYGKGEVEAARAGRELTSPFPSTPQVLEKGKALYEIYCAVCHGEQGKGDGPIATKIPPPPSYKSERLLEFTPGRMFHVITMGANKMPAYAVQLTPDERWQVIAYIQAELQGLPNAAAGQPAGAGGAATPAPDAPAPNAPAPAPNAPAPDAPAPSAPDAPAPSAPPGGAVTPGETSPGGRR